MKSRLAASVDNDVAAEARRRAAERGLSLSALVQRSLLLFFSDNAPAARPWRPRRGRNGK